jgi:predicted nucleic acid-binding protein
MRTFVDTNIVLYAYDQREPEKSAIARAILSDLWRTREGQVSTQVLQELYVNLTRKLRVVVPRSRARALVGRYGRWPVHTITTGDILEATELEQRHSLSFWDALIVVAAARSGSERILTEDLQHGRTIAGVRIENPFHR